PIFVSLVACAALGAFAACAPPPEPPTTAAQELILTPERAKAALLDMMRSKAGRDLGWFDGNAPDEMAKMKIEEKEDGWYAWTGAFRFHASRAVSSFVVLPQPGVRACAFEYDGTFTVKDRCWVASPPKLVSTAIQDGK